MGLGKTAQLVAAVLADPAGGPTLVVCPVSVLGNWQRELARFAPSLSVLAHHGPERMCGERLVAAVKQHDILLTSYALLQRDAPTLRECGFVGVVLDEAQNFKNPETKQSKAARALNADWRVALSGTPVENHVGDLWAIFEFLNPGLLGSESGFKREFYAPIQQERDEAAAVRLKKRTGPLILRRLKTDKTVITDLPDKIEQEEMCPLTPEQASLYEAVLRDLDQKLEEAEGMARRGLVLATLTKLKQVCNHPAQFLADGSALSHRSGKLTRLIELADEIVEAGDRALIFTQFAEMGGMIQRHLRETLGREVLFLHGGVAKKERDALVERFQSSDGRAPLFVLSLMAGGVGLNLTAACHVIHFDRWWNPAVEDQATDRAFRIGQVKNVLVRKFVCQGTLEERIAEMIARKREVAGSVVGTGEQWLTELSTSALKDLFALSRERAVEAVEEM
jgi:SNF2 family DNA or RNA helicase